jgi:hypothetical protein
MNSRRVCDPKVHVGVDDFDWLLPSLVACRCCKSVDIVTRFGFRVNDIMCIVKCITIVY